MAKIKLNPGERELARTPPRWVAWSTVIVLLSMPALLFSMYFFNESGRLAEVSSVFYIAGSLTAINLLLLWPVLRWRIMATDRRIIVRRGFLKRELEEIDRDDVKAVRQDESLIRIEGDGRVIEASCHSLIAGRLLAVIDPARAATEGPDSLTGGLPGPGEDVLLRPKSQLAAKLLPIVAATVPMAAAGYRISDDAGPFELADWAFVLSMPAAMALALGVLALGTVRSQKQWLITGQRILTVQGVFRRHVEDIRLDRIEGTAFDGVTLTVKGGGRTLDIPLGEVREDNLQRVLGRWFPWQGAPAGPVKTMLHDGEALRLRRPRRWVLVATIAAPPLILAALVGYVFFRLDGEHMFAVLMPVSLVLVLLLSLFPGALRDAAWTLLVTDRRVLLRRPHDHGRYDEVPLDAIEEILPIDKLHPQVILRGQGREYRIPASSDKVANLIRETIETAKGEARWRG